jgi:alpha-glucosidase (family GH31 glycosyl hydrolase)
MLEAPLGRPPMLARVGSLIPVNRAPARFGDEHVELGFLLFPPDSGELSIALYHDDGESAVDVGRAEPAMRITARCAGDAIEVDASGLTGLTDAAFILPPGEARRVVMRS